MIATAWSTTTTAGRYIHGQHVLPDGDSDTYGDASSTSRRAATVRPSPTAPTGRRHRAVNPAATEGCNSIDDDCDSLVDDDDSSLDTSTGSTYYRDATPTPTVTSTTIQACLTPSGYVSTPVMRRRQPCGESGATEVCNSIDDDCDGLVDDDDGSVDTSTGRTYYRDGDSDTYGDASSTIAAQCAE